MPAPPPVIEIISDGDILQPVGIPDNTITILPRRRNPKVDVAVALGLALGGLGFSNNLDGSAELDPKRKCTIVTNGTFHQSLIRDPGYVSRPVIVIRRAGESTSRAGIGDLIGMASPDQLVDPAVLEPNAKKVVLGSDATVTMRGKHKVTTLAIGVFDTNSGLADMTGDAVAGLIDHIIEPNLIDPAQHLGYRQLIISDYNETTSVVEPVSGDPYFVYEREFTVTAEWTSHLQTIPTLTPLIEQTLTTDGPTPAAASTDIPAGT